MKIIMCLLAAGLSIPATASDRLTDINKLVSALKKFDPLTDRGVSDASPSVSAANQQIESFYGRKVKRSDEFAALVRLAGYARPLGLSQESVELIDELRERPELQSAFSAAFSSLDKCRQTALLNSLDDSGEIGVDKPIRKSSAQNKSDTFNFKRCLAAQARP